MVVTGAKLPILKYTERQTLFEPGHEFLVIIAFARMPLINAITDVSCKARYLNFGLNFHLYPYFVHMSSEGSGEPVHNADSPEPSLLD